MTRYDPFTDQSPFPWKLVEQDRAMCPVHAAQGPQNFDYHRVNTYDLVREVSRRFDAFSNKLGVQPLGAYPEEEQVLEFADPPEHTLHRQLIGKAFSVARVNEKLDRIQQIADDLVDAIARRGNRFRLRYDFGRLLPAQVIAEILGVPIHDQAQFIAWSEIMEAASNEIEPSPESIAANTAFLDYARTQLSQRLAQPRDDLLSSIVHAEIDGARLTLTQGAAMVRLLLAAGNGTTSIAISNLIFLLETNPDAKKRLLDNMEMLLDSAVEEGLRFDCPVQGNLRGVTHDTEIGGHRVIAGDRVYAFYASANHDPARYDRPDEFVIDRDWSKEARHFAFGYGIHFCLGAELARAETKLAVRTLYERLPNLRLRPGFTPEQVPSITFRTWREVEMEFDGVAAPRLSAPHVANADTT
ncbi:cytochrome P450 [Sphingomonas azotifigens]|uniref:cytochrome P450 n=1 Tax=Sphingomonas azotifigens TaxID=330920 RepID=UPI0009FBD45B|nr:cytochrome P450 [Sphingomonas azotifigens]